MQIIIDIQGKRKFIKLESNQTAITVENPDLIQDEKKDATLLGSRYWSEIEDMDERKEVE